MHDLWHARGKLGPYLDAALISPKLPGSSRCLLLYRAVQCLLCPLLWGFCAPDVLRPTRCGPLGLWPLALCPIFPYIMWLIAIIVGCQCWCGSLGGAGARAEVQELQMTLQWKGSKMLQALE